MKIVWKIKGKYRRFISDNQPIPETNLDDLVENIYSIANQEKIYSIPKIHQGFGLSLLSEDSFQTLLTKKVTNSSLLSKNILPPLLTSSSANLQPLKFVYQFIPETESQFTPFFLNVDDSQIPHNLRDITEGFYHLDLFSNNIDNPFLENIKTLAVNRLQFSLENNPLAVIETFVKNPETQEFSVYLPNNCIAIFSRQELSPQQKEAIAILTNNPKTSSHNPLVIDYQKKHGIIPSFSIENQTQILDLPQIYIAKGNHRQFLQSLIDNAKQFLLISSYRLEDLEIVNLIAKKSQELPFGVWILTDLSEQVQDRVDFNMDDENDNSEYVQSDRLKQECLQILLKAKIRFRSGNFHLKTYISEQGAYLGSCNLTGGSLNRNLEGGVIWQHNLQHQFLIDYFHHLWQEETTAKAIPTAKGYRIESLIPSQAKSPENNNFLNYYQYEKDLMISLAKFKENPQGKVIILTRNFMPNSQLLNLIKKIPHLIFYCNFNSSDLKATKIYHLHSKIVLIGSQVAYLSSQDFAFTHSPLFDLTYKTTNPEEVKQIYQQIKQTLSN
ncbi:phospholipase D family protein [Geminocystis sp. CENA526]|uniref:phospholipase D family protein n=1 Tax=Geminocystis sp. CENA526 TaxID=1355871 RepID=UPI003D6F2B0C